MVDDDTIVSGCGCTFMTVWLLGYVMFWAGLMYLAYMTAKHFGIL